MNYRQIHRHWGSDEYSNRSAEVVYDGNKEIYIVNFYDKKRLVEARKMVTEGVAHSERYAEDAAENWCLGYIP